MLLSVLDEVQSASKLAVMHTFIVAAELKWGLFYQPPGSHQQKLLSPDAVISVEENYFISVIRRASRVAPFSSLRI